MDFNFSGLSAGDINHILYDEIADLGDWIRDDETSSYVTHYINFRNKFGCKASNFTF